MGEASHYRFEMGDQIDDLPIGGVNDDRDDLERELLDKAFESLP